MYDELLPFWKIRRKEIETRARSVSTWLSALASRGYRYEYSKEQVEGTTFPKDCIVEGIMLFTWEAALD